VKVSLVLINARRNPDQVDLHSAYQLAPACQDRHDIRVPEPVYIELPSPRQMMVIPGAAHVVATGRRVSWIA
jgi:hypothetical protein